MEKPKDALTVGAAQFEPRVSDTTYNLDTLEDLSSQAAKRGVQIVRFHGGAITAYEFAVGLSYDELAGHAEAVPSGPSIRRLIEISKKLGVAIMAGIIEKDGERLHNTYVCVHDGEMLARFRKLHPFVNPNLTPGEEYLVFDLFGWKCSILICYDNNIIENPRAVTLLGAEVIFAPHVTGATPAAMAGRGYVPEGLWERRHIDPVPLRREIEGVKGREWIMRWRPARIDDNGGYYVFTNTIGYDGPHFKPGYAMILDPNGDQLVEARSMDNEVVVATLTKDKLGTSFGKLFKDARRPDLYASIIGAPHESATKAEWMNEDDNA